MSQQQNIKNMIFSNELKNLMEEAHITQVKLAKYLDIAQSAVSNYLNGVTPRSDILIKIAQYFDVSMEQLLSGGSVRGSFSDKIVAEVEAMHDKSEIIVGPAFPLKSRPASNFPTSSTSVPNGVARVHEAVACLADQLGIPETEVFAAVMEAAKRKRMQNGGKKPEAKKEG
jgi:transcriptional regulator with XRE-family HTH domain